MIGATARDIIMQKLLQQRSARHTQDLDIAIAIADWQKFEEISNGIAQMDGFEKSLSQKQRFYYKKVYEIDIIPFGEVAKEDKCIYWPLEEENRLIEHLMKQNIAVSYEKVYRVISQISSILCEAI